MNESSQSWEARQEELDPGREEERRAVSSAVAATLQGRGVDITGIFGPGFQGATARGVDVLVPDEDADTARELLADYRAE